MTSPLWCLTDDQEHTIGDMNQVYQNLLTFFEEAPEHLQDFMNGNFLPFKDETKVHRGPVYDSLVKESSFDSSTEAILGVIFPAFAQLAKHMFKDHLAGGVHVNLDPKDAKFASVPKSNKYAECVFGLLDHLITQKPNISTLASEAYLMYSQNRTSQWLNSKNQEDLNTLVRNARKSTEKSQQLFFKRKEEIESRKRNQIAARIKEREAAEMKKMANKEEIPSKMIEYGLWQSETEVVEQVESYPCQKDKLDALKAQLSFRNKVLDQKSEDPKVYNVTKLVNGKRTPLSVEELSSKCEVLS